MILFIGVIIVVCLNAMLKPLKERGDRKSVV